MSSRCSFPSITFGFALQSFALPKLPSIPTISFNLSLKFPGFDLKLPTIPTFGFAVPSFAPPKLPTVPSISFDISLKFPGFTLKLPKLPVFAFVLPTIVLPKLPNLPTFVIPTCPLDVLA